MFQLHQVTVTFNLAILSWSGSWFKNPVDVFLKLTLSDVEPCLRNLSYWHLSKLAVMGSWIRVHELNWIQYTEYESRWIEPNLFSSESVLSWIHWCCWESWAWIEPDLVESCNDESELSLNLIYMNPKWIWIHYLPKRIQPILCCSPLLWIVSWIPYESSKRSRCTSLKAGRP